MQVSRRNRYAHSDPTLQANEFAATVSSSRPKNKALYVDLGRLHHKAGETADFLDALPCALTHVTSCRQSSGLPHQILYKRNAPDPLGNGLF